MLKSFSWILVVGGTAVGFMAGPVTAADDVETQAQTCNGCHGQNGQPVDPKTTPIIWGQQQAWLVKDLRDYRTGLREHPIMTPIAKNIPEEDIRKLGAYFAGKPWPQEKATNAPPSAPDRIALCQTCHQQNFQGGPPAPRLAGLSYDYLLAQMNAFANDKRTDNEDMPKIMKQYSESEREAIARYLSAL